MGKHRVFTSLASKALWLCYPDSVPIFDQLAQRSVQILIKFEADITTPDARCLEYERFVQYWKQLYKRYGDGLSAPLAERDPNKKLHKAKVFDAVLLLFSEPKYQLRSGQATA
jgi:hypothetical protein